MSETHTGVSEAYVLNQINQVRRDVDRALENLEKRIEAEMREIGREIAGAINLQTSELMIGIGATTAEIESTKNRISDEFSKTQLKIDTQIQTTLLIEINKKLAEFQAVKQKLATFIGEMKSRFDKAIVNVAQNRELYNVAFRNLHEEYESKVRTIGSHIFQVRLEDIAPAVKAASIPYEQAHGLPIEMDLQRLEARSASLDKTLALLKSSRLDETLSSLATLDRQLDELAMPSTVDLNLETLCVEGISTRSPVRMQITVGALAARAENGDTVRLTPSDPSLTVFNSKPGTVSSYLEQAGYRDVSEIEADALRAAAGGLVRRGLLSDEGFLLLDEFLGSNSLKYLRD